MYSTLKSGVKYDFVLDGDFLKCTAYKESEYAKWSSVIDKKALKETQSATRCEIEYELSEVLTQLQDDNITHYPEETTEGKPITLTITTVVSPTITFSNRIILDNIDTTHEEKMLYASLLAEKSANETKEEITKALEKSEMEVRELRDELATLSKKMAEFERSKLNRPISIETDHILTQRIGKLEKSMDDIIASFSGRISRIEEEQRRTLKFGAMYS